MGFINPLTPLSLYLRLVSPWLKAKLFWQNCFLASSLVLETDFYRFLPPLIPGSVKRERKE